MYVRLPAIDGVPQAGQARVVVGMSLSPTEAIAIIDGPPRLDWIELTEEEYLALGGVIPQQVDPQLQPSQEQRMAQLEQVIDTLLTGGETA